MIDKIIEATDIMLKNKDDIVFLTRLAILFPDAVLDTKAYNPSLCNKVRYEYDTRGKVWAIKLYRDRTGKCLRDSKHDVEEMLGLDE